MDIQHLQIQVTVSYYTAIRVSYIKTIIIDIALVKTPGGEWIEYDDNNVITNYNYNRNIEYISVSKANENNTSL